MADGQQQQQQPQQQQQQPPPASSSKDGGGEGGPTSGRRRGRRGGGGGGGGGGGAGGGGEAGKGGGGGAGGGGGGGGGGEAGGRSRGRGRGSSSSTPDGRTTANDHNARSTAPPTSSSSTTTTTTTTNIAPLPPPQDSADGPSSRRRQRGGGGGGGGRRGGRGGGSGTGGGGGGGGGTAASLLPPEGGRENDGNDGIAVVRRGNVPEGEGRRRRGRGGGGTPSSTSGGGGGDHNGATTAEGGGGGRRRSSGGDDRVGGGGRGRRNRPPRDAVPVPVAVDGRSGTTSTTISSSDRPPIVRKTGCSILVGTSLSSFGSSSRRYDVGDDEDDAPYSTWTVPPPAPIRPGGILFPHHPHGGGAFGTAVDYFGIVAPPHRQSSSTSSSHNNNGGGIGVAAVASAFPQSQSSSSVIFGGGESMADARGDFGIFSSGERRVIVGVDECVEGGGDGDGDGITDQLGVAGLLLDDDDDDDDEDEEEIEVEGGEDVEAMVDMQDKNEDGNVEDDVEGNGGEDGATNDDPDITVTRISEDANAEVATNGSTSDGGRQRSSSAGLIALPAGFLMDADGNVVRAPSLGGDDLQVSTTAVNGDPDVKTGGNATGSKKKKRRGSNKTKTTTTPPTDDVEIVPKTSTSDAIKMLGATEVSIGETTRVQIKQSATADQSAADDLGVPGGGVDNKVTGAEGAKFARKSKRMDPRRGVESDDAAMLRAARHFNKMVRVCVERSDPDGMRKILRDKHNHRFALDSHVLETVLKAYVMAAMFEDALYCLRNCALPGTLSAIQTERILQCLPQNLRNSSAYTAADMINALCIATHFEQPTSRTYFMRIVRGIALEFLEEATSARDRICSAPCERLVRSAYCVVDARLRRGKKPSDLVVDPGRQLGVFIPDTSENRGMQAGDAVSILPYAGPYPMSAESLDRNMIEATVANAAPLVLRLQDKGNMELYRLLTDDVEGNVYRIDKLANRMGFTRQLAAAVSVVSPPEQDEDGYPVADRRHPSAELIKAITAMDENIDRVMMAGGNFQPPTNGRGGRGHEQTSIAAICSRAVPWSAFDRGCDYDDDSGQESIRSESFLALEKYGALEGLNASQRLAVQGAASNRLTLVQGPPGTGKTAVAIRILQHWARVAQARTRPGGDPSPILATSDSNIAVDNLVEGCANVGLRVVRLGRE
jgi:hypothetical protein